MLDCTELPIHQNPIYWPPPLPLWGSLWELSEVLSPGLSSHFAPNKCSLATITSCVSPAFSMTSLVFPILLLSPFSLHCSVKKIFSSLLSILWSSAFRWVYLSFSLLLSLLFFSQLFVRPPLTTISFFWGWIWSLPPVKFYELPPIVLQTLYQT